MAAQKKPQPELIAIYRLEFYKKQKNWKLSADARKLKEIQNSRPQTPLKNTVKLNETYSIESNVDDDPSMLNDAFLKDESDKDLPVTSTASLRTQSLEPIHACQECRQANKPQNPWADYVDDVDGLTASYVLEKGSGDGNEFDGFDGWADGMVWTNSAIPQPRWTGEAAAAPGAACPPLLRAADEFLHQQLDSDQLAPWPDDQLWAPEIWGDEEVLAGSLDSVEEFMEGARRAPHSSELELAATAELDACDSASCGPAARLSGAALAEAVRRHAGSLRRLLREAGRRRRHRSSLSLQPGAAGARGPGAEYSYDAFPTRDEPGPLALHVSNDAVTPISPAHVSRASLAPALIPNICTDRFTPISPNNFRSDNLESSEGSFTRLSRSNRCADVCTPFSPANLYRDGFLAGSYRNRAPLGLVGRGRGRLREDGGRPT